MSPAPPSVAVVVVSFNAREALLACLDSLTRYVGVAFETVVVDNASEDGSPAAVEARNPEVRVIVNAQKVPDGHLAKLCRDIAKDIERELTYPGEVKVTVVRETRAVEVAH